MKLIALIAAAALFVGCESDTSFTERDTLGHYGSTSDFRELDRREFENAMQAGLRDVNEKLAQLKREAERIGLDAVDEYHDHMPDLVAKRNEFEGALASLQAVLDDEWEDERDDVVDIYEDLREMLDEAYDDVVDEAD